MLLEERLDAHIDQSDDLVRNAQAGDAAAFERLYRVHVGRVYAICRRMVADPARAEALTQDAFVQAWQQLASFRQKSAFSTWLHRLTVNVVLVDIRSRRRRSTRFKPADDWASIDRFADGPGPDAALDLDAGIAALPAQARAVLVLHDVEGYRHEEIGTLMGIAPGTSKAHLHRARQLLRALIGQTE
jgi:RNA polymerase sigma-70 factor (ECF subfamily)